MKHTYKITGMICNGCRSHVEETLQNIDGVRSASVDLEKAEAVLEMDHHVPLDLLETALQKGGGNYHIFALENFSKVPQKGNSGSENDTAAHDSNFGKVGPGEANSRTFKVTGMTCNSCRKHVEETLQKVEGVRSASVDLEKAEAKVEMEKHIPVGVFEDALQQDGGK